MSFLGFGKKKTDETIQLKETISQLRQIKADLEFEVKNLKKDNSKFKTDKFSLEAENENLKSEISDLKKQAKVTLKTKATKGASAEFAEFEAQVRARNMSDSHAMYASLTVSKKVGGRTYVAEAKTVGEMKDIIRQVRQGKLVVVGK